jgi:ligand-binding SRPBCC domain-containing protein
MHCLKHSQKLPLSVEESWSFFSDPKNLSILTPSYLNFEMMFDGPVDRMYAGQIIGHLIRPLWNIRIGWITEITHVQEPLYFIDEQRFGPYKFWHHEHRFHPIAHGVEMLDTIYYQLPLGIFGQALHAIKVKKDLAAIFAYRKTKLEELFGIYQDHH